MHKGTYVFAQIMNLVDRYRFEECVNRYQGDKRVRELSCRDQFLAMAFGFLSFRRSLRDILVCLDAHQAKLYHLGFRSKVQRSTLSDANEKRDWRIYRDLANLLISRARKLYTKDTSFNLDITEAIYAVDSTVIELCLALFPWARVKGNRAAIKLNLGLELHGNVPSFFSFSEGRASDCTFLDQIIWERNSYYIFDRGYLDFRRLWKITQAKAYFVTRAKISCSLRRLYSLPVKQDSGVCCDQIVVPAKTNHPKKYLGRLRRIKYFDQTTGNYYVFLTNNFALSAESICELYKQRWQVELFFKWIKQHLYVESLWGRNENAVKTQICIALCTYLLVAILKKELRVERNSYEILQILSISLLEKTQILQLISGYEIQTEDMISGRQAVLLGI